MSTTTLYLRRSKINEFYGVINFIDNNVIERKKAIRNFLSSVSNSGIEIEYAHYPYVGFNADETFFIRTEEDYFAIKLMIDLEKK